MQGRFDIHVFWFETQGREAPEQGLMRLFGIDHQTASDLVRNVPRVVKRGLVAADAEHYRRALVSLGAHAEVHPTAPKGTKPRARPSMMPPGMGDPTTNPEMSLPPPSSEFELPDEAFGPSEHQGGAQDDDDDDEKTPTRSYMPPRAQRGPAPAADAAKPRPFTDLSETVVGESPWPEESTREVDLSARDPRLVATMAEEPAVPPPPSVPNIAIPNPRPSDSPRRQPVPSQPPKAHSDPLIQSAAESLMSDPPPGSEPPKMGGHGAGFVSVDALSVTPTGGLPDRSALQLDTDNSFLEGQQLPGGAINDSMPPRRRERISSANAMQAVTVTSSSAAPAADSGRPVASVPPPAWSRSKPPTAGEWGPAHGNAAPGTPGPALPPNVVAALSGDRSSPGLIAAAVGFVVTCVAVGLLGVRTLPTDIAAVVVGSGGLYWVILGVTQRSSRGFQPVLALVAVAVALSGWVAGYALRDKERPLALEVADVSASEGTLTLSADRVYNLPVQRLTFAEGMVRTGTGSAMFREFTIQGLSGADKAIDLYGTWPVPLGGKPDEQLLDLKQLKGKRLPLLPRSATPSAAAATLLLPEFKGGRQNIEGGWLTLEAAEDKGRGNFGSALYAVRGKMQLQVAGEEAVLGEFSGTAVLYQEAP